MIVDETRAERRTAAAALPSKARLQVLRGVYALVAAGLFLFIWPIYLKLLPAPAHYHGVVLTMLAAFSIFCAVGIFRPLEMLPILLWELLWKLMWLLLVALPRWMAGTLDAATVQTAMDCATIVVVLVAIPWRYVVSAYARKPA